MSFKVLDQSIVRLTNDVWGEQVVYTPTGGSPINIQGIFSSVYFDVEGVVTLKPTLRVNLTDFLIKPRKGDQVSVQTVNYRIMESHLDDFGGSTLILQKV